LCEMGASGGDVKIDCPVDVFGVQPPETDDISHEGAGKENHQAPLIRETLPTNTPNPHLATAKASFTKQTNFSFGTPSGMGGDLGMSANYSVIPKQNSMSLTTPSAIDDMRSVIQPGNTTTTNNNNGFPAMSLFSSGGPARQLDTPGLTPIPADQTSHFIHHTTNQSSMEDHDLRAIRPPKKEVTTNRMAMDRAKHVVARLYYEPSPEYTPPPSPPVQNVHITLRKLKSSRLSGLAHLSKSRLSFSSPAEAPPPHSNETPRMNTAARRNESADDSLAISEETKEAEQAEEGIKEILELLCVLGAAQKELCMYRSREALQIFHQLPHEQYRTGWVLHQVGRAYFEMADYQNAKRALETMQNVEPHRLKGLEVLSTALWHLKKEVELSHLAQTAVDFDRLSPEAWCVVGNCFSLQKDHETALVFFRRSIQLDPNFTYSHTLSGHEYVSNEDFDKAIHCYRDAIRADDRHYNAWYGLGAIYFRQEKYDLAEYHFHRALSINPQSSVLHCHLGMAQHANRKPYEALETLQQAFALDPRNPQARYQRATIYMALERPHDALEELERVRDAAPRESSVHFAMGKVLKRMGKMEQAMRCFLTALDLDPKDNNLIKAAMDKLDQPDVEEDGSAF